MLFTNHSLFLEAVAVSEDYQNYLTLAQNLMADHPISTQQPTCASDSVQ